MRIRFPLALATLLFLSNTLAATEKYTIVREAKLVVVGTLRPNPPFPWFDGWHFTGTIDVEEVLVGAAPTSHLAYRYIENNPMRDLRMFPQAFRYFYQGLKSKGLWFLKPLDREAWQPSLYFGFDALSSRPDYENYLRRDKR